MMKKISLIFLLGLVTVSVTKAQILAPGEGVALETKPKLVDEKAALTNAPVVADINALAVLTAEEQALVAQAKEITVKITDLSYPLREKRQRMMAQDKELQLLGQAIREKQMELEARLAAKYPDIGTKTKERDEWTRKYSDINEKLRGIRKKMNGIEEAMKKEAADKAASK